MKNEIRYINTDLDLWASTDLTPLANALTHTGRLVPLYVGPLSNGTWSARFETADPFEGPDQNINAMLTLVDALDDESRSLWPACSSREFNIGYDCGDEPWGFNQKLSAATIARLAAAGAAVVVTIYPLRETDYSAAAFDILKKDKSIRRYLGSKIGSSYVVSDGSPFKVNLAEVKMTLIGAIGTKRSVFVHCQMELNSQEQWVLKEIIKKEER